MKAFLGRLPLILGVALVCMAAGAGWAGLGTPSYRSLAVVTSSDVDVEALAGSPEVTTEFLDRVRSKFGANTANTTVGFATGSPARVEISTESEVAGKTQDFTTMYVDAMVAVAPNIQVEQAATFPTSPHSPDLLRIALLTAFGGLGVGGVLAVVAESRRPALTGDTPASTQLAAQPQAVQVQAAQAQANQAQTTRADQSGTVAVGRRDADCSTQREAARGTAA